MALQQAKNPVPKESDTPIFQPFSILSKTTSFPILKIHVIHQCSDNCSVLQQRHIGILLKKKR